MCRNIKTLYNFDPPATHDEIRASAIQFVRKLSGFNAPSKANETAFDLAVQQVEREVEHPAGHHCPAFVATMSGMAASDTTVSSPRYAVPSALVSRLLTASPM